MRPMPPSNSKIKPGRVKPGLPAMTITDFIIILMIHEPDEVTEGLRKSHDKDFTPIAIGDIFLARRPIIWNPNTLFFRHVLKEKFPRPFCPCMNSNGDG